MALFATFGEFDTFTEINELAENLFNEGDLDSIRKVARENGIPEDFVEMYIEGDIPVLCDAMTAAVGKLDVEAEDLKIKGLMVDWVEYIKAEAKVNAGKVTFGVPDMAKAKEIIMDYYMG